MLTREQRDERRNKIRRKALEYYIDPASELVYLDDLDAKDAALAAWEETAMQHHRNEMFWHGIVMECAELCGPEVYVSNDGSRQEDPLALKVVECLKAALDAKDTEIKRLRGTLAVTGHYLRRKP